MATVFLKLKQAIRKALVAKIGSIVVNDWPDYQARVTKVLQYHHAQYEKAFGEAALAMRDGDEETQRIREAEAMDARAAFIDAMREYQGIDLARNDHGLPLRSASYEYKDVGITTKHVGSDLPVKTVQRVLFKNSSSETPELNYPTPYWRGTKLAAIEKYLQSIVKLANEAASKEAMLTEEQKLQAKIDAGLVSGTSVDNTA